MSAIEVHEITGREQWLELRKHDITASTIGALFNCSPYNTIAGLHAEKCGLELPGPDPESSVIRRGNALEAVVAAEVGKLRPEWKISKATEYFRDPKARLGASPDFWIEGDPRGLGVLQTKTIGAWQFKKYWSGDYGEEPTAPTRIILQNIVEVMLADAAFGAIGVLTVGDFQFDCHVIEVPRHKDAEHKIRSTVKQFWDAIAAGVVPELDYKRDGDLLALLYPREVEGSVIDLTRDNRASWLCEERARQGAIIKEAEAAKTAAEVELKSKIGDHEAALINGWRVSLRTTHRPEKLHAAADFRVLRTSRLTESI